LSLRDLHFIETLKDIDQEKVQVVDALQALSSLLEAQRDAEHRAIS